MKELSLHILDIVQEFDESADHGGDDEITEDFKQNLLKGIYQR